MKTLRLEELANWRISTLFDERTKSSGNWDAANYLDKSNIPVGF
jgi:hypothetical protein